MKTTAHITGKSKLQKAFSTSPILDFRKSTSLKNIIGTDINHNNKNFTRTEKNHHAGKCVHANQSLLSTTFFYNNIQK